MIAMKRLLRYLFGAAFIVAGLNHFRQPAPYLRIMPPYLPWHGFLVALSGLLEVLLGGALLVPRLTRSAAWGLIALLVAVFPANLHMALHPEQFRAIPPALLWLRLPIQPLLIALAYWYTRPDGDGA